MLQQVAHAGGWISNNCFNTGSLGLNVLDPVSCRGLFALFALSFDIVSPEVSRHMRLTFAREARIQAYLYCNMLRRPLDGRPDGRPTRPCARAARVCDDYWTAAPLACAQSIDFRLNIHKAVLMFLLGWCVLRLVHN